MTPDQRESTWRQMTPDQQIDTVVLTETDHLTFLGALENQHSKIPDVFNSCFLSRKLLFLGYSLDVWQYRLVMSLIQKMDVSKIYAVRQPKSAMENLCWECLNARLIKADPESFILSFRANEKAAAGRPKPGTLWKPPRQNRNRKSPRRISA